MREIRFEHIYLNNFGKHKNPIQAKLGKKTLIFGANMTGKSTIKRAIQFVLGSRDENGKEIVGIRPHDENGDDIDGLISTAEIGVSVDGLENVLKKTYFQKKNRQGEYTGENDTQYFIDDVKKSTKKSYDEFVGGVIPAMVCMSAQEFLSKDTAGRRAMLEIFSKHDTDSIIDENPDFEPLRAKLKANAISDLKKSCRDKIKTLTKERDAYPARIDELGNQKVNIDVAELELLKNSLNEQITKNKAKQGDISKQFKECQNANDNVLELKFKLNGIQQEANKGLEVRRRELNSEIIKLERRSNDIAREIMSTEDEIENLENIIQKNSEAINSIRNQWDSENKRIFDENSLICPYCGQEYPEERKKQLRDDFEKHKAEELESITNEESKAKELIEKDKLEINHLKIRLTESKKLKRELDSQLDKLEIQYNSLPQSIEISGREDVKEIKQQISEKEQFINKENSTSEIRRQLEDDFRSLQEQLREVDKQIALVQRNVEIDERVESLRQQQRGISQEIVSANKELDLIEQFERKKAELLEKDINQCFDYIQFKMFDVQVNGELKDVCQVMVSGESYDRNLNHGAKILAQIDICRGFQSVYGICSPIIIDDCESLDEWRIPDVPNQLILIKRTDSPELKIEVIE